jgi:hypothetical protein
MANAAINVTLGNATFKCLVDESTGALNWATKNGREVRYSHTLDEFSWTETLTPMWARLVAHLDIVRGVDVKVRKCGTANGCRYVVAVGDMVAVVQTFTTDDGRLRVALDGMWRLDTGKRIRGNVRDVAFKCVERRVHEHLANH